MAATPESPRLTPLAATEWPESTWDPLGALRPPDPRHPFPKREGRREGLNALGTLAWHADLAKACSGQSVDP